MLPRKVAMLGQPVRATPTVSTILRGFLPLWLQGAVDSLFIYVVSEEHLPRSNYIVFLQEIDSATLSCSYFWDVSFICPREEKRPPFSIWQLQHASYRLFPILQSNEKLGGLIFTSSGLQKKHYDFNGNQMSDHYINSVMRHRTNVETLNAPGETHQNGNWQRPTGTSGFLHTRILLQTFPAAANAGSAPLEVAVEGISQLLLLLALKILRPSLKSKFRALGQFYWYNLVYWLEQVKEEFFF